VDLEHLLFAGLKVDNGQGKGDEEENGSSESLWCLLKQLRISEECGESDDASVEENARLRLVL